MLAGEYPFREHGSQGGGQEPPKPLKTSNAVKHLLSQLLNPDPTSRIEVAEWVRDDSWPANAYDAWSEWFPQNNKVKQPQVITEEEVVYEALRVAMPMDVAPGVTEKLRSQIRASFPSAVVHS